MRTLQNSSGKDSTRFFVEQIDHNNDGKNGKNQLN